jgi:glycosyltransferase involved in cell wall biosynthesis
MRILHITEAYGGGITSALNSYVEATSSLDHCIIATTRDSDLTGQEAESIFSEIVILERNVKSILSLYKSVRRIKPDVIHVHSSYAGLIIRCLPMIGFPIIYTPHAFSFLRNDRYLFRKMYYAAEKLLAYRVDAIAGCSKHEAAIARSLNSKLPVFEVVNVAPDFLGEGVNGGRIRSRPLVGMVGRVCEQKGAQFFADVAQDLRGVADFIWIGAGDKKLTKALEDAGVHVAGWMPREEVLQVMSDLDIYLYTAAWDGFPISVLEAAKLNVPILLREIGPFKYENLFCVENPCEAASILRDYPNSISKLQSVSENINHYHTMSRQSEQLYEVYAKCAAGTL